MTSRRWMWPVLAMTYCCVALAEESGNRLGYLDASVDPYYVHRQTARLITPQWIGEADVQAVIVLAIDDMTDAEKYEQFLRPILAALKEIDGRSPVSIMTKQIDTSLPRLAQWAAEGVSVEAHTQDHPCPCLQGGDFDRAKSTYDRCIDQLSSLPGGPPVAFRMPCCDSMNSVSPRFFAEIFDRVTPQGHFLAIDTSVFMLFTPSDSTLPPGAVRDSSGGERFRKYLPADRAMANYIEDYPYPYVIGKRCWEFPSLMPSDWDAQHLHGKCNPDTDRDFKAAIDATVAKQGVFALCFHPHGWIRNDQIVELIDYARRQYGRRVKFLNFREVLQRLNDNLLDGASLRTAGGDDNGVRILDVNADGLMDVVIGNPKRRENRIWDARHSCWNRVDFPVSLVRDTSTPNSPQTGVRFGILQPNGFASVLVANEQVAGLWHFDGHVWREVEDGLAGLVLDTPVMTQRRGRDQGVRLRDLDADGICELVVANHCQNAVFGLSKGRWERLPFGLPDGISIVDANGKDAGLRFVDVNGDGRDDLVRSNAEGYSVHAFVSMQHGWANTLQRGTREASDALPMIVRPDGTNNGAWFNHGHMWVQNEDTGGRLEDHVERRSLAKSLAPAE